MSHKSYIINSFEELVQFAVDNFNSTKRYELRIDSNQVFADHENAKIWLLERNTVSDAAYAFYKEDKISYEEYREIERNWESLNPRPEMVVVKKCELNERTSSWHFTSTIHITPEMGEAIEKIWTKKENRYYAGNMQLVGTLTIAGILNRLGYKEVNKRIAAAKKAYNDVIKAREEAYRAQKVQEAAKELLSAIKRHGLDKYDDDEFMASLIKLSGSEVG